jgi:hypothetical protein
MANNPNQGGQQSQNSVVSSLNFSALDGAVARRPGSCAMLRAKGGVEMRKITFAVYSCPKEGLPYLAVIIAPNGAVAAAAAYKTAAEAEAYSLKLAMETAKVLR